MKKMLVAIMLVFMIGSVFALQAPRPVLTTATSTDSVSAGPWQSLWQMHYKWNPETKSWVKRVFVPSAPRGTFDFKSRTWSN